VNTIPIVGSTYDDNQGTRNDLHSFLVVGIKIGQSLTKVLGDLFEIHEYTKTGGRI
jgi:hypothetical protein